LMPDGASNAVGALGYARMVDELLAQCAAQAVAPTAIVLASGSGGTQAGIAARLAAANRSIRCIGIDVHAQAERVAADVCRIGREVAALLGAATAWDDQRVDVVPGYARPAYGVPDGATLEAIDLAARLEGLALDPVYAGKGMVGLIGLVRAGHFARDNVVIWLHKGGIPAAFAYPVTMARSRSGGSNTPRDS
jgi:L-cysteate sulfo-lyase